MLKKIALNISWLFFDKILKMALGLFVVLWLARYLGPELFGQLNFASALIAIFGVIAALGLKGIVVRDLVDDPQHSNETLGSAFVLKLLGAIAVYACLLITIILLKPDDELTKSIVAILGLTMLFKSSEIIHFWFESQVNSKYVVWVENTIFIFISSLKIVCLWQQASLIVFVYLMAFESALVAVALMFVYAKVEQSPFYWKATLARTRSLLKDSWPLIISSAAWIVYTRIDQIMIGQMLNHEAVGQYSAATKLSEIVNIIPMMIAFSIIPAISKLRKTDNDLYQQRFQMTYDIVVWLMLALAAFTTFFSQPIITLFFGLEYQNAAGVLSIHIWSIIFIAMATVSGRYLINEGLQKVTMQRHLLGVLLNLPLNFVMIPIYGIEGAAMASLLSLALANYCYDALSPATRICFIQKSRAFVAYGLIQTLRK